MDGSSQQSAADASDTRESAQPVEDDAQNAVAIATEPTGRPLATQDQNGTTTQVSKDRKHAVTGKDDDEQAIAEPAAMPESLVIPQSMQHPAEQTARTEHVPTNGDRQEDGHVDGAQGPAFGGAAATHAPHDGHAFATAQTVAAPEPAGRVDAGDPTAQSQATVMPPTQSDAVAASQVSLNSVAATTAQGSHVAVTESAPQAAATCDRPGADTAVAQLNGPIVKLAQTNDGASSLSVSLHPKDLGEVKIRLERAADGSTRVTVAATEPGTLRSLMADQAHLHAALDAAALSGTDRQVSFELATNSGGSNGASGDQTSQSSADAGTGGGEDRRGGQARQPAWNGSETADGVAIPPAASIAAMRTGTFRSGVNFTA